MTEDALTRSGCKIKQLAELVQGEICGDSEKLIEGVATLASAGGTDLAFHAGSSGYLKDLRQTRAGVVILSQVARDACKGNAIIVDNPHLAFAKAVALLHPEPTRRGGISSLAIIADSAIISPDAQIAAGVVIESEVKIEAGVVIGANCVIGCGSMVGRGSRLDASVTIYANTIIGQDCHVLSGSVIGSDGFGFARDKGAWLKVGQLGRVLIGNHVHICSNVCIDRGSIGDTIVADGVIIDNLVQIAHNVKIGQGTAIAGCAAIAGSTTIGKDCLIAGRVAIVGHLNICDAVQINADSLVTKSISKPGVYAANWPARPVKQWRKLLASLKRR